MIFSILKRPYRLYYLLTVRPPNTLVKLNASCKHLTSSFKDSSDIDGTQPHPLPVPWLLIRTGCHNRSLWHIDVVCWIEFIRTDQWLQIINAKRQQCFLLLKAISMSFPGLFLFSIQGAQCGRQPPEVGGWVPPPTPHCHVGRCEG